MRQERNLKVVNLNLWASEVDLEIRLATLKKYVDKTDPDVLLLQENLFINGEISQASTLADACGYYYTGLEFNSSPAILTKLSPIKSGIIKTKKESAPVMNRFPYVVINRECHKIMLTSLHLPWGPREDLRLKTMYEIEKNLAVKQEEYKPDFSIIGGDFNSQPYSDTIRFIEGKLVYNNFSTLWLNSAAQIGISDFATSSKDNPYAQITAKSAGITYMHELPNRVIDYQFINGYAYGKIGYPQSGEMQPNKVDDLYVSDHSGMTIEYRC